MKRVSLDLNYYIHKDFYFMIYNAIPDPICNENDALFFEQVTIGLENNYYSLRKRRHHYIYSFLSNNLCFFSHSSPTIIYIQESWLMWCVIMGAKIYSCNVGSANHPSESQVRTCLSRPLFDGGTLAIQQKEAANHFCRFSYQCVFKI